MVKIINYYFSSLFIRIRIALFNNDDIYVQEGLTFYKKIK